VGLSGASRGRVPGGRVPAYTGGSSMKDDRAAKLYAGQMGIAAVRAVTHFNEVLG
jgi:hypothetical protein